MTEQKEGTRLVVIDIANSGRRKYHHFRFYTGRQKIYEATTPKGELDHEGVAFELLDQWFLNGRQDDND